jgi:hypothetical protein
MARDMEKKEKAYYIKKKKVIKNEKENALV